MTSPQEMMTTLNSNQHGAMSETTTTTAMPAPRNKLAERKAAKAARIEWVVGQLKGGNCPSLDDLMDRFAITKTTAYLALRDALEKAQLTADEAKNIKRDAEVKGVNIRGERVLLPRRRIIPLRFDYSGGFSSLHVSYETMWGKCWGDVGLDVDIRGKFRGGRLRPGICKTISKRIVRLARRKWGEFICDLTPGKVLEDLQVAGIARCNGEAVEPGYGSDEAPASIAS